MILNLKKYMMKMKNIKYVVFLIENNTDKVIDTILCKEDKELFDTINDTDFDKLNCKYSAYKEINAIEVLQNTIKYL